MAESLDDLRNDAVSCFLETVAIYAAWATGGVKQENVILSGKYFVTAVAKYTLACADAR